MLKYESSVKLAPLSREVKLGVPEVKVSVLPEHSSVCCSPVLVPAVAEQSGVIAVRGLGAQDSICLHVCVLQRKQGKSVQGA